MQVDTKAPLSPGGASNAFLLPTLDTEGASDEGLKFLRDNLT